MVVCNPCYLSFVAWWIQYPLFLCWGLLARIPFSVLITWHCNWIRRFKFCVDRRLESVCLAPAFFDDEYVVDPYVVKPCSKTKSPIEGPMFGPHLVEVRYMTKSSNEGHILGHIWLNCAVWQSPPTRGTFLGHIWLKSAAWQSSPTRGTFWATFGWSPLHDKVLWQGAHLGPHLVKVCCLTKSSKKGLILSHIWSKSAAWQSPPMRGTFWATFGQSLLRDKVL